MDKGLAVGRSMAPSQVSGGDLEPEEAREGSEQGFADLMILFIALTLTLKVSSFE